MEIKQGLAMIRATLLLLALLWTSLATAQVQGTNAQIVLGTIKSSKYLHQAYAEDEREFFFGSWYRIKLLTDDVNTKPKVISINLTATSDGAVKGGREIWVQLGKNAEGLTIAKKWGYAYRMICLEDADGKVLSDISGDFDLKTQGRALPCVNAGKVNRLMEVPR